MIWTDENGIKRFIHAMEKDEFNEIITYIDSFAFTHGDNRLYVELKHLGFNWSGPNFTQRKIILIALMIFIKKAELIFNKKYEPKDYIQALLDLKTVRFADIQHSHIFVTLTNDSSYAIEYNHPTNTLLFNNKNKQENEKVIPEDDFPF